MNYTQRKAKMDLAERQALLSECRRQQQILDSRGDTLTPTAKRLIQQSLRQKLDRCVELRTGKPAESQALLERQRAV